MIKTIVALFALYGSSSGNRLILQAVPQGPPAAVPPHPELPVVEPPVVEVPLPVELPPAAVSPPAPPGPPAPVVPEPIPPAQPPALNFPWSQPVAPVAPPMVPAQPVMPIQPVPPPMVPPQAVQPIQPPAVPVNPIGPPAVNPPAVNPPFNPWQQPPAPPQAPPTVIPPSAGGGMPWQYPHSPGFLSTKLECKKTPSSPTDPLSCSEKTKDVINPSENYEVLCSAKGACYRSTINVVLDNNGYPIERLKLFAFIGEYAAANAHINVSNLRGGQVRIDEIKCDKPGACLNMQITLSPGIYLEQGDFYCTFGACDGCMINGVPCYYYVEPI